VPRASILTAVYNCQTYIRACVASALAQTIADVEIVIVDDGSTDSTAELLAGIKDDRLVVVRCQRMGQSGALNVGLKKCSSQYVAILDADDLALPERIQSQVEFLDANPRVVLAGSRFRPSIDANDRSIGEDVLALDYGDMVGKLRRHQISKCMFHSSIMFRKSSILALGGYDENLIVWKEVDLFVRVAKSSNEPNITNIDKRLSLKRIHTGQFYGPQNGVRSSPEGQRSMMTVKRRIDEAFGEGPFP
jgi:glycosyltransferase involved in cell wall biosynthesis